MLQLVVLKAQSEKEIELKHGGFCSRDSQAGPGQC